MAEKKPRRPHTGARVALITLVTFGMAIVTLATIRRSQEAQALDTAAPTTPEPPLQAAVAPALPPVTGTRTASKTAPSKTAPSKAAPAASSAKAEEVVPTSTKVEEEHHSSIKADVITPTPEPPAASAHMESAKGAALVTIQGCLERKGDQFRLKETDGPKSRSWKTGFLTKHSRTLDVTDAPNALILRGYTGRRVSVTGTFVDGELHARSLESAKGSCE